MSVRRKTTRYEADVLAGFRCTYDRAQPQIGDRVVLTALHPHAGERGEYVRDEAAALLGVRNAPIVLLDSGIECFVFGANWRKEEDA